jgi:hypothetical protein
MVLGGYGGIDRMPLIQGELKKPKPSRNQTRIRVAAPEDDVRRRANCAVAIEEGTIRVTS